MCSYLVGLNLIFGLSLHILPYFVYERSEGLKEVKVWLDCAAMQGVLSLSWLPRLEVSKSHELTHIQSQFKDAKSVKNFRKKCVC